MEYTEDQLPVKIRHGEYLNLADGSSIRWESNGEAKNIFTGGGFEPDVEIFPGNSWEYEHGGVTYRMTAEFDDALLIEKI